jgi:hypothetical protein
MSALPANAEIWLGATSDQSVADGGIPTLSMAFVAT